MLLIHEDDERVRWNDFVTVEQNGLLTHTHTHTDLKQPTWNSKVLLAPQLHAGMSVSEGMCWDETHRGEPPRLYRSTCTENICGVLFSYLANYVRFFVCFFLPGVALERFSS